MYKAGPKLFVFFYFYHATGKSMEISMYKAGPKLFVQGQNKPRVEVELKTSKTKAPTFSCNFLSATAH